MKPWLDKAMAMLSPDPVTLSRIHQQYGLGVFSMSDWPEATSHYKGAYQLNPSLISAVSTIAYCYEQQKDYRTALEWYERYLKLAKPGTRGDDFATQSVKFLKSELFMEE